MKRKFPLIATFIAITILGSALLLKCRPGFAFEQGDSLAWNMVRSIIFSGMIATICTGIFAVFIEKERIDPYIKKFKKFEPLLLLLVRRDFLAKYKRSVLGVLWSLLNPLLTMLVLTIVFSFMFRFEIENYPVYLLSGQIIFTMYSEITNMCMPSVLAASALMKKVSVPKYIFPLSRAISSLVNFGFSFVALVLVMLITRAPFHWSLFYTPIAAGYAFIFAVGIGMLLSALLVFFRDITYLYGILMTAVMYFTPLFYPISIIPDKYRWIMSLNPLYHFVACFRTCVIEGQIPGIWQNLICLSLAMVALFVGLFFFEKKQDEFILYI